jgi:hypothetical protein
MTFTPATPGDSLAPAEIVGPSAVDNIESGTLARILVDAETVELVKRLATRQRIPEATALKKALVEAEYFYKTVQEGGRLLVEKRDRSIADIKLKEANATPVPGIQ